MSSLRPPLDGRTAHQEHPQSTDSKTDEHKAKAARHNAHPPTKGAVDPFAASYRETTAARQPFSSTQSHNVATPHPTQPSKPTPAAKRAGAKPALLVNAEKCETTFVQLMHQEISPEAHKALCHALLPLTDKAQGFKALTLSTPNGQVVGLTHSIDDLSKSDPPQHSQLGTLMFAALRTVNREWSDNAKLAANLKPCAPGFHLSGSRLLRRRGNFYLAPSESYGLPQPHHPAFDELAVVHARFLHAVGADSIRTYDHSLEGRLEASVVANQKEMLREASMSPIEGPSVVTQLCARINMLLASMES